MYLSTIFYFDPFASPFRPKQRVKTLDRQLQAASAPAAVTTQAVPETTRVAKSVASGDNSQQPALLAPTTADFSMPQDFKLLSESYEVSLIKQALAACQYNQKKTADAPEPDLSSATWLYEKIQTVRQPTMNYCPPLLTLLCCSLLLSGCD